VPESEVAGEVAQETLDTKAKDESSPAIHVPEPAQEVLAAKATEREREREVSLAFTSDRTGEGAAAGSKDTVEEDEEDHSCAEEEAQEEEVEGGDATVRGSIKKLSRFLQRGAQNVLDPSERKRNVIVLGLTGSGKSTLINSMAGCKMRQIDQREADEKALPTDTIVVHGRAFSKIGNTYGKSETSLVQAVPLESDGDTILWDAPGFEDSHGAVQNIANAVNLQRLLEVSSRSDSPGPSILLVLDAPSLDAGRGGQVKKTIELLSELFGGQQHNGKAAIQKNLSGIVFVLTKTQRVNASLNTMKIWVIKLAGEAGVNLEECHDKIVSYNPMCRNDSDKEKLRSLLAAASPIGRGQRFRTTLNAGDEKMLRQIFEECTSSIKECMSKADGEGVRRDWELLEALQVVDHEEVAKCVGEVRTMVAGLAQEWRTTVRVLHTNLSAEGRKEVKRMLDLLKSHLDFVREVGQVDLQRELEDLHEEVKSMEATHQGHENGGLRERFSRLQKALRDVLINIADADLRERFSLPQKVLRDALINRADADIGRESVLSMQAAAACAEEGLAPFASYSDLAHCKADLGRKRKDDAAQDVEIALTAKESAEKMSKYTYKAIWGKCNHQIFKDDAARAVEDAARAVEHALAAQKSAVEVSEYTYTATWGKCNHQFCRKEKRDHFGTAHRCFDPQRVATATAAFMQSQAMLMQRKSELAELQAEPKAKAEAEAKDKRQMSGTRVRVSGLVKSPQWNEQEGTVPSELANGRVCVKLDAGKEHSFEWHSLVIVLGNDSASHGTATAAYSEESKFGQQLAISKVQEGRDVLTFIDQTEEKAKERRHFVFGDQHSIVDLVKDQRTTVDREFRGIVREWKINSDVRERVRLLEKHINNATDSNFIKILQHNIAAKNVRDLVDLGFSKMATEVMDVDSLVQESAALLSDRKNLLCATGQVESVVNEFLGSLKQQAIQKQIAWTKRADELVNQITKILHEEQYERDATTLVEALDGLLHYDASKCLKVKEQIKMKIDKYQSKGELDKLFDRQNFHEIARRNRTVKKLKQKLALHLELDDKIVHDNSQQLINFLIDEAHNEIERVPDDPQYLDFTSLRKLTACLPIIREAFGGEAESFHTKLREVVTATLEKNVQRVKKEVESIGRARMTASSQCFIAKMLVKGYSIATELSMQSGFQDRINVVLASGLDDEGLYVIGASLSTMSKGGDVTKTAAEIAQTIIDHFPQFKDFNTQLFNSKAQSVRCVHTACLVLLLYAYQSTINSTSLSLSLVAASSLITWSICVAQLRRCSQGADEQTAKPQN
jgi:GTPase SAR1 family protein